MKKIFLLLFIFSFLGNSKAQITSPFPDTSASWTILINYYDSNPPTPQWVYDHSRNVVVKDTLIDTLTYFKLGYSNDLMDTTYEFSRLYRIDSLKVYFRENNGSEFLRYDFGMDIGDSIYTKYGYYSHLNSIDTVTIQSGQSLIRYNLSCLNCFYFTDDKWYFGVGSAFAPFTDQHDFAQISSFYYKGECYLFDVGINYDSTLCTSANLLKVGENNLESIFSIYPNPSNGNFTIETENNLNSSIEILDLNGKIIFTTTISSNQQEIELNVENGIYIFVLQNSKGISRKKIIISD